MMCCAGPNADATTTMQANYEGPPCFNYFISPITGLSSYAAVTYVQGTGISNNNKTGFAAAISAASTADATILVVGLDMTQESEGNDRTIVALPGSQLQLIQQVCGAAKGPCIVVSINGGGVDLSWARDNATVAGILWAGYPGPLGGRAIAQTIFGDNIPAGRLTSTWYPASFTTQVSMFDMNMRPGTSLWPGTNPGRTYRFYTEAPVFPFGLGTSPALHSLLLIFPDDQWIVCSCCAGLSYSNFTYTPVNGPLEVPIAPTKQYIADNAIFEARYAPLESETVATYWINVTNNGPFDADDAVLGFVEPPGGGENGTPLQFLFGFQRVHVPAGQSVLVWLGLEARHLTQVQTNGARVAWPGKYTIRFGLRETAAQGQGLALFEVQTTD
jgi:hypothetical protein